MSSRHKLRFSNPFIFATWCRRPNSQSYKYKKFTPSGWKYKGVRVSGKTNSIEGYIYIVVKIKSEITVIWIEDNSQITTFVF